MKEGMTLVPSNGGPVQDIEPRESCSSCRFYYPLGGLCRKNPPAVRAFAVQAAPGVVEVKVCANFPTTKPETWCGAYERLPT